MVVVVVVVVVVRWCEWRLSSSAVGVGSVTEVGGGAAAATLCTAAALHSKSEHTSLGSLCWELCKDHETRGRMQCLSFCVDFFIQRHCTPLIHCSAPAPASAAPGLTSFSASYLPLASPSPPPSQPSPSQGRLHPPTPPPPPPSPPARPHHTTNFQYDVIHFTSVCKKDLFFYFCKHVYFETNYFFSCLGSSVCNIKY